MFKRSLLLLLLYCRDTEQMTEEKQLEGLLFLPLRDVTLRLEVMFEGKPEAPQQCQIQSLRLEGADSTTNKRLNNTKNYTRKAAKSATLSV